MRREYKPGITEVRGMKQYAEQYNCSVPEAIADRDYPLTRLECIALLAACGIAPLPHNVAACKPDTNEQAQTARAEFDEAHRN